MALIEISSINTIYYTTKIDKIEKGAVANWWFLSSACNSFFLFTKKIEIFFNFDFYSYFWTNLIQEIKLDEELSTGEKLDLEKRINKEIEELKDKEIEKTKDREIEF